MTEPVYQLQNKILDYTWGSKTLLPAFLGKPPSASPQAEMWMGTHPKNPSAVTVNGRSASLSQLISENTTYFLGRELGLRFSQKMPYLFKILAVESPLSLQAHPDQDQANAGFRAEESLGIPLDSPERNFKDPNAKPEMICALSPFTAMVGFRPVEQILSFLDKIKAPALAPLSHELRKNQHPAGLKNFFSFLLLLPPDQKKQILREVYTHAETHTRIHPAYEWLVRLNNLFPGDIGVLAPILMNLVRLMPGEALFLPPGQLHSYLEGFGLELMANSDNVLRGGLTSKHSDVPALLEILAFSGRTVETFRPFLISETESIYPSPVEEFILSVIHIDERRYHQSTSPRGIEILLCTQGSGWLTDENSQKRTPFRQGQSFLVPAQSGEYLIEGRGTLFKASAPL